MSIRQLPQDVVDKLKSSVVITTLHDVASGLLENSLDARATKVNITVDFSRGNCTVEDNGQGIEPGEFSQNGGLGRLHHTSKFPPSATVHGQDGNFLASLATLSLLSVASRHHRHISHNSILIHNATILSRRMPAPTEQHLRAFERGTRVGVRDLFGSMPVRVKQRSLSTAEHYYVEKEWTRLVANIVAVLLAWPSDVSVSLRDSTSQREIRLRPPEGQDLTTRTSRLLTQVSVADFANAGDWVPLSASARNVSVQGCISSNPVPTRNSQFISVGIKPLHNEHGTNIIYEEINKIFTNSSFGAVENDPERQPQDLRNKDLRVRKGVDRWPIFYFRLRLGASASHNLEEILDDRNSELAAILDLLKAVCYGFLKKHHHRPRKVRLSPEEQMAGASQTFSRAKITPLKRTLSAMESRSTGSSVAGTGKRVTRSESPFDGWQRVKVGHATKKLAKPKDVRTGPTAFGKERLVGKGGLLLGKPFGDFDEDTADDSAMSSSHFASPVPLHRESCAPSSEKASGTAEQLSQRSSLIRQPKAQPTGWLKEILGRWSNPVFEHAPLAVPRAYDDGPLAVTEARPSSSSNYFAKDIEACGVMFESYSVKMSGRISKAALMNAEVVSQVDLKFILVKLPLNSAIDSSAETLGSRALVMLDQHAVDERCKLEDLMASYFVIHPDGTLRAETECLEQPLKYEVREQDADLLAGLQAHFSTWGIVFTIDTQHLSRSESKHTIRTTHLPPSILQRCLNEPQLLITLLRNEADALERPPLPPELNPSQHPWVIYFHNCPSGILELLHSRSCRSAIMFNDVLTKGECEKLVKRVARCAFPFQCAHGRPSMAPVIDLGVDKKVPRQRSEGVDWKRWINE